MLISVVVRFLPTKLNYFTTSKDLFFVSKEYNDRLLLSGRFMKSLQYVLLDWLGR